MIFTVAELRNELIRDEGLKLVPYRDTMGHLTIGVGHLILPQEKFTVITHQEAMDLLDQDIQVAERRLDKIHPKWRQLDEVRQRGMLNLTFNLGMKLAQFKKFLHSLSLGNFDKAADQLMQSKWYGQVKLRAPRIVHAIRTGEPWSGA